MSEKHTLWIRLDRYREITEKGEERKIDLYISCFILGKSWNFQLNKVSYNLSRMMDCHVVVMKYYSRL